MSDETNEMEVSIELVLDKAWQGTDITVSVAFIRRWEVSVDTNYGADADGNRGERRETIEDDRYEDILVNEKPIATFPAEVQQQVKAGIEGWMRQNEPAETGA